MTKNKKKGPAFLLKTYDMLEVNILSFSNKNLNKLSIGTMKELDSS